MTLELRLKSALITNSPGIFGEMRPYIVVSNSSGAELKRTSIAKGKSPAWDNEAMRCPDTTTVLIFTAFDEEAIKKDDFVGRGVWTYQRVMARPYEKVDEVVPLECHGRRVGWVRFEVYYDEGRVLFGLPNNLTPYLNLNNCKVPQAIRSNSSSKQQFNPNGLKTQRGSCEQRRGIFTSRTPQKNTPTALNQSNVSNGSRNTSATRNSRQMPPTVVPPRAQQPPKPPAQQKHTIFQNSKVVEKNECTREEEEAHQPRQQSLIRIGSLPSLVKPPKQPNQPQNSVNTIGISNGPEPQNKQVSQDASQLEPAAAVPQNLSKPPQNPQINKTPKASSNLQTNKTPNAQPQNNPEVSSPETQRHPALNYLYSPIAQKVSDPGKVRLEKIGQTRSFNLFTLLDGCFPDANFSVLPQKLHNSLL